MAGRTNRAMVAVSPAVRDRLNRYQAALRAQEGRSASYSEIIGALLQGVPLWQADLMLKSYTKHTSESEASDAGSPDAS